MLSSLLLLVAPLLLATRASAAPSQLIQLGSQEKAEIQCNAAVAQTITVTKTVSATPTSLVRGASIAVPAASSSTARVVAAAPPASSSAARVTALGASSAVQPSTSSSLRAQSTPVTSVITSTSNTTGGAGLRNALYFTNWGIYGANYQPDQLPAANLTHILYAFADIGSDGEVKTSDSYADLDKHYPGDSWNDSGTNAYGCVKQLFLLKKKYRHLKTLLSIGGWTYSPKFAPVAATEAGRRRFCSSAITLMKDWGFDGLDIDWEYPANAEQAQHFVLLLRTCRQALDAYAAQHAPGYRFLITIATSAGAKNYNTLNFTALDPYLDAWHLMTYDFAGSWDSTTGHQSNILLNTQNPTATKFSADQAVHDYIAGGVQANKIVLGIPLYGRTFESTTGLGQPYSGIGPGTVLYKDLPLPGAQEFYDNVAMASYSFDRTKGELVTYDTVASALAKSKYLLQRGLGGAVYWEASGDQTGAKSLVGTVAGQMRFLEGVQNNLRYPISRYDNIRAGVPGK
ncbi:endochitinase 1 [Cladorrhinum sp. PSN259]|nr:endochitinase 1 [Cladorrhinum sp. PSN259]